MGKDETKDEGVKLGKQILYPKDMKFSITYKGEIFTMRYPMPFEKQQIEAEIARRLDGHPRATYSNDALMLLEATAYVNALVIAEESPSWFTSAWTCMDEELIATLYGEYLSFRSTFRKKLQEGGFTASR